MRPVLLVGRALSSAPRRAHPLGVDPGRPGSASPSGSARRPLREGVRKGDERREHQVPRGRPHRPAGDPARPRGAVTGRAPRRGRLLGGLAVSALLALILGAALLSQGGRASKSPTADAAHRMISGVGMPATLAGNVTVRPLRIALVLGGGLSRRRGRQELEKFEGWLSGHVNPATRLTVLEPTEHTRAGPFRPAGGADLRPVHDLDEPLGSALREDYTIGRGQRVLLNVAHRDPSVGGDAAILDVHLRQGADLPTTVNLIPGAKVTRSVDPDLRGALAATLARGMISISHMSEAR